VGIKITAKTFRKVTSRKIIPRSPEKLDFCQLAYNREIVDWRLDAGGMNSLVRDTDHTSVWIRCVNTTALLIRNRCEWVLYFLRRPCHEGANHCLKQMDLNAQRPLVITGFAMTTLDRLFNPVSGQEDTACFASRMMSTTFCGALSSGV
jgi:hypothetical protein